MINESDLAKHYQNIARKLNEIVPVEWDEIVMYGEETGDVSTASFYYRKKGDSDFRYSGLIPDDYSVDSDIYLKLIEELMDINKALWQEFNAAGAEPWKTVTFRLGCDYSFKISFGYDIDSKIGDLEREIRWAYDELGVIPKDSFGKKILNEYLREGGKEKN